MSEEQNIEAKLENLVAASIEQGVAFVLGYAPKLSREDAEALVLYEMQTQADLEPVMLDLLSAVARNEHPEWGFQLLQESDGQKRAVAMGRFPKVISGEQPMPVPLLNSVGSAIGFLSFAPLRALARAYGLEVSFFQAKAAPKKPALSLV